MTAISITRNIKTITVAMFISVHHFSHISAVCLRQRKGGKLILEAPPIRYLWTNRVNTIFGIEVLLVPELC
jgi:hypothetical protein